MKFAPCKVLRDCLPWRRPLALASAGILALSALSAPALGFELFRHKFFERKDETLVVPDAKAYTVEVEVKGGQKALVNAVSSASTLVSDKKRLPPGNAGLLARARGDYGRILAALYRRGFYGGAIHITINGTPVETLLPNAALPDPAPVKIGVDPGPQFTFGTIHIEGLPQEKMTKEDAAALKLGDWALTEGEVARSGAILDTEGRLVEMWRQRGHPLAKVTTRDVVADHRTNTVDVTLVVSPGPAARFGRVQITGTKRVDPEYARWMTDIKPGAPFDPDALKRARKRLQDLGVFASVSVVEADHVGPDGLLDVTFNLSERKRHLIGGGASYATTDGATLEGYWMHRNLFGHAESLRFDASVSRIGTNSLSDLSYGFATTFRRPGVFTPDTDMTLRLAAEREFVDTYDSTTFSGKAGLEHRFNEHLTGSTALNAEWADINDAFGNNKYMVVSLPSEIDYDLRNNKLDPTNGLRGTLDLEPLADVLGGTVVLVAKGSLAGYRAIDPRERAVLAGRVAAGSIVGGTLSDVPATRRFFLGGGGSIRGYAYRSIGPVSGGQVVGGLSFWEASAELRFKVTDTIGIVPFVDAGTAYEQPYFDLKTDVSVGAGLGVRYYTPLGPLRFDVAIPVYPKWNPKKFAFYVGLGQAF